MFMLRAKVSVLFFVIILALVSPFTPFSHSHFNFGHVFAATTDPISGQTAETDTAHVTPSDSNTIDDFEDFDDTDNILLDADGNMPTLPPSVDSAQTSSDGTSASVETGNDTNAENSPSADSSANLPEEVSKDIATDQAVDNEVNAMSQEDWDTLWQNRIQDLYALQQEAHTLRMQLPNLTDEVEKSVDQGRRDYRHIFALVQAKHTAPNELVVLDAQLEARINDLESQLLPVKEILSSLDDRRKELQSIAEEFTNHDMTLPTEGSGSTGSTVDPYIVAQNATMQNYFAQLTRTQKNASLLHSRLQSLLEPGEVLLARMNTLRATVQKNLPTLWRDHYLAPSAMLFDLTAWTVIPSALASFTPNAIQILQAELPSSTSVWVSCAMRFLFIVLPLIAILQTIRKKLQKRYGESHAVLDTFYAIRHGIGWIGFGFALHFASYSSGDDGFRAFVVPANIFLVWGQIALAWSLRALNNPSYQKHSPFSSFEYLVIISLILLFFNPPLPLLGLVWIAAVVMMIAKRHKYQPEDIPTLEAAMLKVESFVLWGSLIIVVLGWGRLAMVLYMAFVALSVSIQLGVALMALIDSTSAKLPKEGSNAIIGGVLLGLAAPLVLVLVAAAIVLWIIAYPGGAYLLQHAVAFNVKVGAISFDGLRVLFILTAFYVTRSLTTVGTTFLAQLPSRLPRFDRSMIQPMQAAFSYILWGLFALYCLQALGVSLTSLAVIAGGLSVGIGFGLQTIVNNFMSGLILIFGRSLQEGDVVDLGGTIGTVRKVNIRATTVETFDNAVIFVPNSDLVSNQIINWTRNSRMVRRDVNVGVAYGSDVALVQKLLHQVAEKHRNVLLNPPPMVIFNDFGASTLDFILRVWISDINIGITIMSELRSDIDAIFRENNIEIAFPQMDIHVRSMAPAADTFVNATLVGDSSMGEALKQEKGANSI